MLISEIYNDVALDNINEAENAQLSYAMFNRLSKRAELRLLDYISGDIEGVKMPAPYTTSKVKDFLSPFIKKFRTNILGGVITKPTDYYGYENMYKLGENTPIECDEELEDDGVSCNTIIELLDGAKYNARCKTKIEGLQPSFEKPISKLVGSEFEFNPSDLGAITLEYIRYPEFGKIVSKMDDVYNQEIVDESKSVNYEWDEKCRELLCFFITDTFSIHTREQALKTHNQLTSKLVRDTVR